MPIPRIHPRIRFLLLVGLLAAAVLFARATSIGRQWFPSSIQQLQALHDQIRAFDPYDRAAYVLLYAAGCVLLVPGTVMSFLGATLYGMWLGTALTWLGAVMGSSLCFAIVRLLGQPYAQDRVNRLLRGRFAEFHDWVDRNGFHAFLIVRLLPIFPFNGVNFAAGLTGIRFLPYFLATAIGILPGTFVYQYLFANVGRSVLLSNDPANQSLLRSIGLFLAFLVLASLLGRKLSARIRAPQTKNGEPSSPSLDVPNQSADSSGGLPTHSRDAHRGPREPKAD